MILHSITLSLLRGWRVSLLVGFCYLLSLPVVGQELRGRVIDAQSGESLVFATVSNKTGSQATATDEEGYFLISLVGQTIDTLMISYVGYRRQAVSVDDFNHLPKPYTIQLVALANLPTVEVVAPTDYEGASSSVLSPSITDMNRVPTLAGEADPLKALAALPGVSIGFEGSSSLQLRGGNDNQTNLVIDGVQLFNVNHIGGYLSAVPNFGLKSATVYKGGVPGRFGGRLSGTVDLRYRYGRNDKIVREHTIGTGLIRTGIEGPIGKRSTFLVSGRLAYPTLIATASKGSNFKKREFGKNVHFFIGDFLAKYRTTYRDWQMGVMTYISGDTGYDQFESTATLSLDEYNWSNQAYAINARRYFSSRLEVSTQLSYLGYRQRFSSYSRNLFDEQTEILNYEDRLSYNRVNLSGELRLYPDPNLSLTSGLEASIGFNRGRRTENIRDAINGGVDQQAISVSSFIQANWTPDGDRLKVMAALRSDVFIADANYQVLQPRIRGTYRFAKSVYLNFGLDRNAQFENQLRTIVSLFPSATFLLANDRIQPAISEQVYAGFGGTFGESDIVWSVEVFAKQMNGLLRIRPGRESAFTLFQNIDETNYAFDGMGEAQGLELYLRKSTGRWHYSMAYTLSKSERTYPNLNEGRTYPFTFDRRHDVNLQSSYQLNKKWLLSASWVYQTGVAVTTPVLSTAQFDIYRGINNSRYPPFHRLNINMQRIWAAKKKVGKMHSLTFSIYNAYARRNPYFITVRPVQEFVIDPQTGLQRLVAKQEISTRSLFGLLPGLSYRVNFE